MGLGGCGWSTQARSIPKAKLLSGTYVCPLVWMFWRSRLSLFDWPMFILTSNIFWVEPQQIPDRWFCTGAHPQLLTMRYPSTESSGCQNRRLAFKDRHSHVSYPLAHYTQVCFVFPQLPCLYNNDLSTDIPLGTATHKVPNIMASLQQGWEPNNHLIYLFSLSALVPVFEPPVFETHHGTIFESERWLPADRRMCHLPITEKQPLSSILFP